MELYSLGLSGLGSNGSDRMTSHFPVLQNWKLITRCSYVFHTPYTQAMLGSPFCVCIYIYIYYICGCLSIQ